MSILHVLPDCRNTQTLHQNQTTSIIMLLTTYPYPFRFVFEVYQLTDIFSILQASSSPHIEFQTIYQTLQVEVLKFDQLLPQLRKQPLSNQLPQNCKIRYVQLLLIKYDNYQTYYYSIIMKRSLTSAGTQNSSFGLQTQQKIDENDPKYLRKVIAQLINKSKSVIQALEGTMIKLQSMQKEKQFWKCKYLKTKNIYQTYINNERNYSPNFSELKKQLNQLEQHSPFKLEQKVRKNTLNSLNCCHTIDRSQCQKENKLEKDITDFGKQRKIEQNTQQSKRKKRRLTKSISTISFNQENLSHIPELKAKKQIKTISKQNKPYH